MRPRYLCSACGDRYALHRHDLCARCDSTDELAMLIADQDKLGEHANPAVEQAYERQRERLDQALRSPY